MSTNQESSIFVVVSHTKIQDEPGYVITVESDDNELLFHRIVYRDKLSATIQIVVDFFGEDLPVRIQ